MLHFTRKIDPTDPRKIVNYSKTKTVSESDEEAADTSDRHGVDILSAVKTFGEKLSNIIFILLLVAYSFIGGAIFNRLEADNERQLGVDAITVWNDTFDNIVPQFVTFCASELQQIPSSGNNRARATAAVLASMMNELNLTGPEISNNWDIWQSTFYATTLYTTIGYGDRAPATTGGRAASIVYAIIGIPITLVMLNEWGKMLFHLMQATWRYTLRCFLRFPATSWLIRRTKMRSQLTDMAGQNGHNPKEDEDVSIPTGMACLLLFAWICMFAGIYTFIETDWTYFESFYFFFISLTTIGLGDYVPRTAASFYTSFPMILIGLSVISLCINVLQTNVEKLFNDLVERVNLQYQANIVGADDDDDDGAGGESKQNTIAVKSTGMREGMLMKFMPKAKTEMLEKKATELSNRRSRKIQTDNPVSNAGIQCVVDTKTQSDNTIGYIYVDCDIIGSFESVRSHLSRSASDASLIPSARSPLSLFSPK